MSNNTNENTEQPKRVTNVERVTNYMEYSKQGALAQAFLIEAVTLHAKRIVENEKSVLKRLEGSFINGQSWVNCAKDWLKTEPES